MGKLRLNTLTATKLARCTDEARKHLEAEAVELIESSLGIFGGFIEPVMLLCQDPRLALDGPLAIALRRHWEASRDAGAGLLLAMMPVLSSDEQLRLLAQAGEPHPDIGERMGYVCEGLCRRASLDQPVAAALVKLARRWPSLASMLLWRHGGVLPTSELPALVEVAADPPERFTDADLTRMPLSVFLARLAQAEGDKDVEDATIVRWRTVLGGRRDSPSPTPALALLGSSRRDVREVALKQLGS